MSVDIPTTLARLDAQLRRDARALPPGRTERAGPILRWLGDAPDSWEAVVWADIDESSADAVIAEQVAFFAARGRRFEWKYYAHDRPVDLPQRLLAAGFRAEGEEWLMVAETSSIGTEVHLPDGVRIVPAVDAAGVEAVVRVHDEAFGDDNSRLGKEMLARLESDDEAVRQSSVAVLAMAGDRAVSAARVEFHEGTDFAGLWGGGTLPEWRSRGIYRALLAYRAGLAAERGYRYLQVDSAPDSQPILGRLGFVRLTTTTPYVMESP